MPVYAAIGSTPQMPDLVIMAIPVGLILDAFKECCEHGCKQFVIYTA
ncbi:MAG: hypothetical protein H6765_00320 [Candidatus Peribacteria bacterium]|nr:MAG: hypothetical protein H6765_00320 [Candidatus Peribacteria bacterium]